jgi:hypothetical protein
VVGRGLTVTLTTSLAASAPSETVSLRTYDPLAEKLADVVRAFGVPNVTVPGPLAMLHVCVSPAGGSATRRQTRCR